MGVCKWTDEVFTSCIDIDIAESGGVDPRPGDKNVVTEGAAGGWGGSCTCPDGQIYEVGDNNDACESLACTGGKSGKCNRHEGSWSFRSVTCSQASPTPEPTQRTPTPTPNPTT